MFHLWKKDSDKIIVFCDIDGLEVLFHYSILGIYSTSNDMVSMDGIHEHKTGKGD